MQVLRPETEAQWLDLRTRYGGSSEAPALFGLGYENMPSAWSLWALKSQKLPREAVEEDDRIWLGQQIQPVIANFVTRKTGWDLDAAGRTYYTLDSHLMGATLDFLVREHEDGVGIIECKNRDWARFFDAYTDDRASTRDEIQLAHQMACTGLTWGCIAVLVGGNELRMYRYKADQDPMLTLIEQVKSTWSEFWGMVTKSEEPGVQIKELPDWLRVHAERPEPEIADLRDAKPGSEWKTFDDMCENFEAYNATAREAKKLADSAKAAIIQALDKHERGTTNRFMVECKYSDVPASVVKLPDEVRQSLRNLRDVVGTEEDAATIDAALNWQEIIRKASTRTSLTVRDAGKDRENMDPEYLAALAGQL